MTKQRMTTWWSIAALVVVCCAGCQMHRMPGNRLPSFAASQQDRAIAKHAAKSGFPSPSDVGLASDDE